MPGLQAAGRCQFLRLVLAAGRSLQGMAHAQHSSELPGGSWEQPPEPWHLPVSASGQQIPAASSLQPLLSQPAALGPWFYGLDLLPSFSSSPVRLQTRAIFQPEFSGFSLTSISSCSSSAPVHLSNWGWMWINSCRGRGAFQQLQSANWYRKYIHMCLVESIKPHWCPGGVPKATLVSWWSP